MNYSTAIFLVNRDVRAIAVSYERTPDGKGVGPFTGFKTLDRTIKVGDLVVCPTATRMNMTVCRVEDVDLEIDFDATAQLGWIVVKVDDSSYKEVLEKEAVAIQSIKSAEKRAKQDELRRKLLADNPDLESLSAITIDQQAALPAPPQG